MRYFLNKNASRVIEYQGREVLFEEAVETSGGKVWSIFATDEPALIEFLKKQPIKEIEQRDYQAYLAQKKKRDRLKFTLEMPLHESPRREAPPLAVEEKDSSVSRATKDYTPSVEPDEGAEDTPPSAEPLETEMEKKKLETEPWVGNYKELAQTLSTHFGMELTEEDLKDLKPHLPEAKRPKWKAGKGHSVEEWFDITREELQAALKAARQ